MSKLLLLPLLLLLSCENDVEVAKDTVGQTREFLPVTIVEDNTKMKAICDALSNKENILNVLTNSGNEYTFTYQQKGCDDGLSAPKTVVTKISRASDGYIFKTKNGEDFGFIDVETYSHGVMADICGFEGTRESPIRSGANGAVWWSTYTSADECKAGFGTLCVALERGTSIDGKKFKIHTKEIIKFKIFDDRQGFFLERKLTSSADCKNGSTVEMRAALK